MDTTKHRQHQHDLSGPRVALERQVLFPPSRHREPSEAEREFLAAIESYKRSSGRMFPTWTEVLEVVRSLGYVRPGPPDAVYEQGRMHQNRKMA